MGLIVLYELLFAMLCKYYLFMISIVNFMHHGFGFRQFKAKRGDGVLYGSVEFVSDKVVNHYRLNHTMSMAVDQVMDIERQVKN